MRTGLRFKLNKETSLKELTEYLQQGGIAIIKHVYRSQDRSIGFKDISFKEINKNDIRLFYDNEKTVLGVTILDNITASDYKE